MARKSRKLKKQAIKKVNAQIKITNHEYLLACRELNSKKADKLHETLKDLFLIRDVLLRPEPKGASPANEIPTYRISTMLIREIKDALITGNTNVERICYCTGIEDDVTNTYVPMKALTPRLDQQSAVFAKTKPASTKNILLSLDEYEHTMLLHCHSHPGAGPSSTFPSSIDKRCHKDLEEFYPVIGIIFSQDGYFRAFSVDRKFEIDIFGKGVEKHGKNIFRLFKPD